MVQDFDLVQRLDFIQNICRGRSVLHLGCTNYPYTTEAIENEMLLHFELEKIASSLYGFDSDPEGIDILARHGSKNVLQADLERLDEVDINKTFDVIVAGEMIEHLNNPGVFLKGIQRFMDSETRLVVTTINAFCGSRFFRYGLKGKGGRQEAVHPDHVAYYSYSTLSLILRRHGLRMENFFFYDVGPEHRPHQKRIVNILNDICVKIAPQWADGIIAVCRIGIEKSLPV